MISYETFNSRPYIKDYLFTDGYTVTPADIRNGIIFEESVNSGDELVFGSCVAGSLTFSLYNLDGTVPDVTGTEFRWRKAVEMSRESETTVSRQARPLAMCGDDETLYVGSDTFPYLSIWDKNTGQKRMNVPSEIAPSAAAQALVLVQSEEYADELYALHGEEPYVTAYNVSIDGFIPMQTPALSAYQIKQVKKLCAQHKGSALTPEKLIEYLRVVENNRVTAVNIYHHEWAEMGYFIAEKPEKLKETLVKVQCYDRMAKFDVVVDDWLASLDYPVALADMLDSLCSFVGVEKVESIYTNGSWEVPSGLTAENMTGREILQYIAQANAGFCRMRPDGKLELVQWQPIHYSIDNSIFNSLETAEFLTDPIDKVQLKVTENDIGVIVGAGTNALVIENNPLLYGESDSELRPAVTNIYNYASAISYQPFSVEIVQNPLVRAGDIFNIVSRSGETITAYVMNRTLKGGIDTYEATGDQRRSSQTDAVNRSIQNLRGKIHEMSITVDEFSSKISDMEGNYSSITQTIDQISFDVYNKNGDVSVRIAAEVENGLSTITLSADDVYIQGKTTLSSIFTSGTTTIDGGKITAGTVQASELSIDGEAFIYTTSRGLNIHPQGDGDIINLGSPSTSSVNVMATYLYANRITADSNIVTDGQIAAYSGIFEGWCYAPDWTNGSDRSLKHEIEILESQRMIDFINGLRPVKYRLNADEQDKLRYGFIAQEVQEALQLVGEDEGIAPIYRIMEGVYGLNYTEFIAPMVSMMQEMWQRITRLEEGTS